jgi:FkbM family methyltransferase
MEIRDRLLSSPLVRRMKSPVARSLRSVGYQLQPVEVAVGEHVRSLLERGGVDLVIDVGANQGQYAERMRAHGYTGRIVSFEPGSAAFARLRARARNDESWEVRQCALGARPSRQVLHLSGNSVSSSLLDIADVHVQAAPASRFVESETVQVERLDDVLVAPPGARSTWLKLDVQGGELDVLAGAEARLRCTSVVEVELSFRPLYQGGADYLALLNLLAANGFVPVDVQPGLRSPSNGDLLQADLVAAHVDLLA